MSEPTIKKWLFAPTGMPVTHVMLYTFTGRTINELTDDGQNVEGYSTDDIYESINTWETSGKRGCSQFVMGSDNTEFLTRHCRVVTVDIDYEEMLGDGVENAIEAWPDDIIQACVRVRALEDGLKMLKLFHDVAPKDTTENPISKPAMENLILKPIEQDIETLEAKIAAFRVGRTEPESLGIEEDEDA